MPYNDMYEFYNEDEGRITEFNNSYVYVCSYKGQETLKLVDRLKQFKSLALQYKDTNLYIDLMWVNFDNIRVRDNDLLISCDVHGDITLKNFMVESIKFYEEEFGDTILIAYEYDDIYIYFFNEKVS